jgi:hypothetical protein
MTAGIFKETEKKKIHTTATELSTRISLSEKAQEHDASKKQKAAQIHITGVCVAGFVSKAGEWNRRDLAVKENSAFMRRLAQW